ncbi:MAG: ZIP family metal transporter [Clostridia bacterium]|nr:ZIP family metal transporter [Clostridia bacterium]
MTLDLVLGLSLPFLGTVLGAATVFLCGHGLRKEAERALTGFAAGIMVAASVFSLLLPAIDFAAPLGLFSFLPATVGVLLGFFFLMLLGRLVPHCNAWNARTEGANPRPGQSPMLVISVTLHNLPEGMAIGVVLAARLSGDPAVTTATVLALALGIGIQNFPEGAIISMPLHQHGTKRSRAFLLSLFSAIVESAGALITLAATAIILPLLPYFLAFAAGAMLFVVVEELIPDGADAHTHTATVFFAIGFCLMMALDVALG